MPHGFRRKGLPLLLPPRLATLGSGFDWQVMFHELWVETRVRVVSLDEMNFLECVFLKIDVEGHELEVLEGAENTLRRTRPRLLIEVRDSNLAGVDRFLESLALRRTDIRDFIGCAGAPRNYFYMPEESPASR